LAPLMAPLVTAGFGMTLFSKSIGPPAAIAMLFWYVATYLAFFFEDSVAGRTDFLAWPIAFYCSGAAMAAVLSQIGNYPRLFDYFDTLRTNYDAGARVFDRRRTVWEGLVVVLSIFAIYFGTLFLLGTLSDGCLLVPDATAVAVGWVMVAAGLVGIIIVVLVTIFDSAPADATKMNPASIERIRMWKYAIIGIVLIGGHILVNDLLATMGGIGIWYGLVGLIPVILVWVILYWWIIDVPFYSDMAASEAIKLNGNGEQLTTLLDISSLDGFRVPERVVPFVVTGGLYNVVTVLIVWLVVSLVAPATALLYGAIAALVTTAVAIIVVIILANTTTIYYSGVKRID
jgi:hypothetical protein